MDHFSILELLYYTKELGYEIVGGFYVKDLLNKQFVLITYDQHLLHLIKNLKYEDTFKVFVYRVLDEPSLDTNGPISYLTNDGIDVGEVVDLGGEGETVNLGSESVDVNLGEKGEPVNLGGDGEAINLGGEGDNVNLGGEGVDANLCGDGVDDNLGGEGKLGGDKDYLASSDCWSDDSDEQPDVDIVRGVDIPARDRSKKVRYDEDCEVSIFELGIVFEGASEGLTVMSAMQKRLVPVLLELLPNAERRMDARHIWKHNQVNKVLLVVTTLLCQVPLKQESQETIQFCLIYCCYWRKQKATTSFGVYFDPTTRIEVFNPGTSSEKILHGPTKLKSASPTNIDIDFKRRGLKWKGKDAVSISQSQQMKTNKKNKGSCRTSKK
ncbi:hypothetical protein KY284_026248 [Solanum tuberosum]|nr:hypothetical protein KY284_026248 [Solanum tuberosum]